jgi:hypothetical protein
MNKKFIVRLSDEERAICQEVVKKLKGSSEKVRRAQILLKADADGPGWTDSRIAEAFDCRVQTIENLRKRLVTEGFEAALGKASSNPFPARGLRATWHEPASKESVWVGGDLRGSSSTAVRCRRVGCKA